MGWGPEELKIFILGIEITQTSRRVFIKRKFPPKQKQWEGSEPEVIPLTGHTSYFYGNWKSTNASSQVLNIISGYKIPFVKEPYQYHQPMTQVNSDEERVLIEEEVNNLQAEDVIEKIPMSELYYSSSMFLVAKRSGGK